MFYVLSWARHWSTTLKVLTAGISTTSLIVSCFLLFQALRRIKRTLNAETNAIVDHKMMIYHVTAFTILVIINIAQFCTNLFWLNGDIYYQSNIVWVLAAFTSDMLIAHIIQRTITLQE